MPPKRRKVAKTEEKKVVDDDDDSFDKDSSDIDDDESEKVAREGEQNDDYDDDDEDDNDDDDDEDDEAVNVKPTRENTLRILISSDNHIGYLEKDPIRGQDSFNTFEEVMQIAKENRVDMVLLGGDLFHYNKPTRPCLFKVMEILRKYTLGDGDVAIRILSDQKVNFGRFERVNYQDPNFNVELPVFIIHGNHDDPSGDGALSALDVLAVGNLINYFGKVENIDDITLFPILLSKGCTQVALYGLGNVRDERLFRTFREKKVRLMRSTDEQRKWFNMFAVHQNRIAHKKTNFLHESFIPDFIDFVLWGHEHESLVAPRPSGEGGFYVCQPGSTVTTSLIDAEARKKQVGILEIYQEHFRLTPIDLQTVRPFYMDSVVLKDVKEPKELSPLDVTGIMDHLAGMVNTLLEEHEERVSGGGKGSSGKEKVKKMEEEDDDGAEEEEEEEEEKDDEEEGGRARSEENGGKNVKKKSTSSSNRKKTRRSLCPTSE